MTRALLLVIAVLAALSTACATTSAASSPKLAHHHAKKRHPSSPSSSSSSAAGGARSPSVASRANDDDDDDRDDGGDDTETAIVQSEGAASYYHDSLKGSVTANGEKYDPDSATCAHRSLPFGTILVVEDVSTGKKTQCRVNDRGPYVDGRLIDVSRRVARDLNMIDRGVIKVRIRIAKLPTTS